MAKVTHSMTLTRLLRNGLTHARLQALFESSESTLDFYDRLKQVGIDRKAAKSMAARLVSSGLMCRGGIEKDSKLNDSDNQKNRKAISSDCQEDTKVIDSDSQKDGKVIGCELQKDTAKVASSCQSEGKGESIGNTEEGARRGVLKILHSVYVIHHRSH